MNEDQSPARNSEGGFKDHWSRDWVLIDRICQEYKALIARLGLAKRAQNRTLEKHFSILTEHCHSSIAFLQTLLSDRQFRRKVERVFDNLPRDVVDRSSKDAEDVVGDMCFRIFYKVLRNSCEYKDLRQKDKQHWGAFLWCASVREIDLGSCSPFETEVFRCVNEKLIDFGKQDVGFRQQVDHLEVFTELMDYIESFPATSEEMRKAIAEDLGSPETVELEPLVKRFGLDSDEYRHERDQFFRWVRSRMKREVRREI